MTSELRDLLDEYVAEVKVASSIGQAVLLAKIEDYIEREKQSAFDDGFSEGLAAGAA